MNFLQRTLSIVIVWGYSHFPMTPPVSRYFVATNLAVLLESGVLHPWALLNNSKLLYDTLTYLHNRPLTQFLFVGSKKRVMVYSEYPK